MQLKNHDAEHRIFVGQEENEPEEGLTNASDFSKIHQNSEDSDKIELKI
jgi:hypothetical protein